MRTRLGLKVLGLSALVMGVMAIGVPGAAHAEEGACWGYINPSTKELKCFSKSTLAPKTSISVENNTGTLLIVNVNLEILCTGLAIIEGGEITGNSFLGRAELSGCISLSKTPLTKLNPCTPSDPVAGLGKIRTEKGIGLIVLHNGEPTVELKSDVGSEVLAKVFLGEECSVSEELIVSGKLILHDAGGKASFEEHKLTHLAREFPSLQLMRIGVNKATIDGTATIALEGPHNTLLWGGHAG